MTAAKLALVAVLISTAIVADIQVSKRWGVGYCFFVGCFVGRN